MEFMNMGIKTAVVRFDEHEYKDNKSCHTSLYRSAKRHAFPIDVVMRNGEIYLVRRDM